MSEKDMKIKPVDKKLSDEVLKNVTGGKDCYCVTNKGCNADCDCLWSN